MLYLVDKANLRENNNDGAQRKMESPKQGPSKIADVFTNGAVRIQCGNINECINI